MNETYGMYNPDGSVAVEAKRCILTGRPVNAENSVRERIPGTNYFYRVLSSQYGRVTEEMRDSWHGQAPSAEELKATVVTVDYRAMTPDELQALVETRNLFVVGTGAEGAVLKRDLVKALREADNAG